MSFKFAVGDYVIVDQAFFDDWSGITFKVVHNDHNTLGHQVVRVVDIATMDTASPRQLYFYPGELTYEDGSRP